MKTLLMSLGLTALAGTASAFPRIFLAPPAIVIGNTECGPVAVGRYERPVHYVAPRVEARERREVRDRHEVIVRERAPIVREHEIIRRPAPVTRTVVVRNYDRR